MAYKALDLTRLRKAQAVFERFRQDMVDDRDEAGAVHAFKFCYDLAWKTMKKYLAMQGIETILPKDTFRKAALANVIEDPKVWFDFLEKRDLILHIYEQKNLKAIVALFGLFSTELNHIIEKMETGRLEQVG